MESLDKEGCFTSRSEVDSAVNNLNDITGHVSHDEVVTWLRQRFLTGSSYTWAGTALIAVNGGQESWHLYTELMKEHYHQDFGEKDPPHLYAVAARARQRLLNHVGQGEAHQAIVISGDSGAGKTFTAYHLLNFLTTFNHHDVSYDIAHIPCKGWRIWSTMPVLMAFGNAHTECNHNSSRFGKLIQLQYGFDGEVKGAYIQTFMLEKTRVASQGKNQKNFHIFQQVLAGLSDDKLEGLQLKSHGKYKVVSDERGEKEGLAFIETSAAMLELGLSSEEVEDIYRILAAIIHLGNISFMEESGVFLIDLQNKECVYSFLACCKLLGLEDHCLLQLLTSSLIAPQNRERRYSAYNRPFGSLEACRARRDCLMRFLYEALFHWIVLYINQKVEVENDGDCRHLGILDIYGFEVFSINSLEQLCINYCNERLQSYFVHGYIDHSVKVLRQELSAEFTGGAYASYDTTLTLLHEPAGSVFSVINEASLLGRQSSQQAVQLCERIYSSLGNNQSLLPSQSGFTVRHFAGAVNYSCHDLVDKNVDKVPPEVRDSLTLSTNNFICCIMAAATNLNKPVMMNSTVLTKYQRSLDSMMSVLDKASIHYIRCVKASSLLHAGVVDVPFFKQQLISSGILDLIPIVSHRFRHFPHWFTSCDFQLRYQKLLVSGLSAGKLGAQTVSPHELLEMLQENKVMCDKVRVGRQSVFVSEAGLRQLEEWQRMARLRAALCVQKAWRTYKHHKQQAKKEICESDGARRVCELPKAWVSPRYRRTFHYGDGIISRMRLAEVPIRFHTRGTCLHSSHRLPHSELPKGLPDALPTCLENDTLYLAATKTHKNK